MSDDFESGFDELDRLAVDARPAKRRRWRKLGGYRYLPSGRVQVRVRGFTPDGIPFALEQTVEAKLAEATLSAFRERGELYRAGLAVPEQSITLADWQRTYLAKRSISAEQKRWTPGQESAWKLLRRLHRLPLQSLTQETIAAWVLSVTYRGTGRAPRGSGKGSPAYILHTFELLNRLIMAAIDARVLSRCPWGAKRPACVPTHGKAIRKRAPLEDRDLAALLAAARESKEPSLYLRLWTQAQTGVRPHELARAQISWLVPVQSVPSAAQVPGAALLRLPKAKDGQAHGVPIDAELFLALRAHIESLPQAARATGLIFPVLYMRRWRKRQHFIVGATFAALRERAGLGSFEDEHGRKLVSYQTRHTRLSDVANDPRMGSRAAQAIAGHQTDSTIIHDYLGHAHRAVPAAAFEPSATLARALAIEEGVRAERAGRGLVDCGDDRPPPPPPPPPPKPRGRRDAPRVESRGARVKAPAGKSPTSGFLFSDSEIASVKPISDLGARAHKQAPASSRTYALRRETARASVPATCPTLTMPTDSELFSVAQRVLTEGAPACGAAVLHALPPIEAASWARELIHESAKRDSLGPAAFDALCELADVVRRGALRRLVPSVPNGTVSRAITRGCAMSRYRFTRKIAANSDHE